MTKSPQNVYPWPSGKRAAVMIAARQAAVAPLHARSQHTPSTKNPHAHAPADGAGAPNAALQMAAASQLFPSAAAHVSGSLAFVITVHRPGA